MHWLNKSGLVIRSLLCILRFGLYLCLSRFYGFNLKFSERVNQTTAGSVRGTIAFVKSGMHLGIWKDVTTDVDRRIDLSGRPWQLYSEIGFGATRTQPGKMIQIACADSTGADITP